MFNAFNPNNLWLSKSSNSFITLSDDELKFLANKIFYNGGILNPNTYISVEAPPGGAGTASTAPAALAPKVVSCGYTVIIIQTKPYILIQKLGQGVYGSVFKGYSLYDKSYVAIKKQSMSNSQSIVKQCKLTKANGIGLADLKSNSPPAFLMDRFGYFALPLADTSFDKWCESKARLAKSTGGGIGSPPYKEIISALIKICDDLIRLHNNGYVHMDLKSDNVLMVDNVAYVSDFGQSEYRGKLIPSAMEDYKQYPQCGPEYFIGVSKESFYTVSHKFDLYSMGSLIKGVSQRCSDKNMKGELYNISTYLLRMDPDSRASLETIKVYLSKLLNV